MTSIIITYHNEGLNFLMTCVNQIRRTADIPDYEIIVVDDCSISPLPTIDGVKVIRNSETIGVGRSFDVGVSQAIGENIVLTACDMRFTDNHWLGSLVSDINLNPKSLICTACVIFNEKEQLWELRRQYKSYGATILFYHDWKTNPKKHKGFKSILEAKWYEKQSDTIYELPCILGACYGVKKSWYEYIDGFWGHNRWGTLEPYISLKSWLFGGNCMIDPKIETAHIFKKHGTHGVQQDSLIYNKLMVATMLFPDKGEALINFLGSNSLINRTKLLFKSTEPKILEKREEYSQKTVYSMDKFIERWLIDYTPRI